jgi:exopolysaccharide biosynthesis operon protein EpsL
MASCHFAARQSIAFIVMGVASTCIQAQDVVTYRASVAISQDDNFLRGPTATAVTEEIYTQNIGARIAVPYSLQRFELDIGLTNYKQKRFSNFDYLSKNYTGSWFWSYTPRLRGTLSTSRTESLNATSDSVNPGLRNRNVSTITGLTAEYELGGALRVLGGYTSSRSINEQALIGQSDNQSNSYNTGLRYSLASGSSVGYGFQRSFGSSTNGYVQTTHSLNGAWQPGGSTSVTVRVAHSDQHYSLTPEYDFSGISGSASMVWRLTGKTTLTTGWQRDLASFQTSGSTHTRTDTLSVAPAWQVNAKNSVGASYRYSLRSNQGSPTGIADQRHDILRDTSISYSWQPRQFATVSTSYTHSVRTSDNIGLDYISRLASLSAQFSF